MHARTLLILAGTLTTLVSSGQAVADTALALSNDGGDAWSFRKRIEGTLVRGECNEILVATPAGEFRATRLDHTFVAIVDLAEGQNTVQAVCRNGSRVMARSEAQHWTVRIPDKPKAWARAVVTHDGLVLDAGRSEPAPGRPAPIVAYEWDLAGVPPDRIVGRRVALRAALPDGDHAVRLRVTDGLGRTDDAATIVRVRNGQPVNLDLTREHPAWADDAIVYGAVPVLFGPRGLADVSERLDAIAALGATVIWLSPINASPADDFGYAVTDHFALRSALGSESDLRELVQAAHARGLRVILDFVPNHASDQHPYYLDAARRGTGSAYARFFDRDARNTVTNYFDWSNLKNLNFDDDEVQRYVIAAFARWIRDFDVDGFRVDASWGIRERAPEFWPRWREELKRIKPDIFLLAEASARDPYYLAHGFDAAYDWTDKLGEWAWQDAFDGAHLTERLRAALRQSDANALTLRFLENNDTGARFITRYGPGRTRVAAAMLFTLPGIPLLYTGQERGAAFEPYRQHRPIDWADDPHGLCAFYRNLARLRTTYPALRGHTLRLLDVAPSSGILGYVRAGETADDDLIVLLNFLDVRVEAKLPDEPHDRTGSRAFIDLMSGDVITSPHGIAMSPFGARILRRR